MKFYLLTESFHFFISFKSLPLKKKNFRQKIPYWNLNNQMKNLKDRIAFHAEATSSKDFLIITEHELRRF